MRVVLNKRSSLLAMLVWLTALSVAAQVIFFVIHSSASNLLDDLVKSSISREMLHPVILLPIFEFIFIQLASYSIFVGWIWFVAVEIGESLKLSEKGIYFGGLIFWAIAVLGVLALNRYYYPDSFFASIFFFTNEKIVLFILTSFIAFFIFATVAAFISSFLRHRHRIIRTILLAVIIIFAIVPVYNTFLLRATKNFSPQDKPNIILIGLDSVRPDFTGYLSHQKINTPSIDEFLKTSAVFTENYSPLARTFPSWVGILTAKYPKHSEARSNLSDPAPVLNNKTLAQILKQTGYETIYATDEKRFSNITEAYGFDRVLGAKMGLNDFILAGLSDFPLTNLLINLSAGQFLFPYNHGNRAEAITYEPKTFLRLVKLGLAKREEKKPLFLAIHLCTPHWPFTWARDGQSRDLTMAMRYKNSVEEVDKQLGDVMRILKENSLLKHSIVVLLSDHGTTLGLRDDRVISERNYIGEKKQIKKISVYQFDNSSKDSLDFKRDFSINTSIGQGTDILSLKQNHTLLAFKGFGIAIPAHKIFAKSSLLDIAPTFLDILRLPSLSSIDGISLAPFIFSAKKNLSQERPLFFETGFSISDIETSDIVENKIIHRAIGFYSLNPKTGLLFVKPAAEKLITRDKQYGVLFGDWFLVRYPMSQRNTLEKRNASLHLKTVVVPPYFVLVNLKTGRWTIGLHSAFAKGAPVDALLRRFYDFYGDEIRI